MCELLVFSYDHPTQAARAPTVDQACALYSLYDLVAVRENDWGWGDQELTNSWFRIIAWPAETVMEAQALLSPLLPLLDIDGVAMTLWQRRGFYLDLSHELIDEAFKTWWEDDTRAAPIFTVPETSSLSIAALTTARPHVPDPDYMGSAASIGTVTP